MKLQDPLQTVSSLVGSNVIKSERCCGESGTLAVARPDISTQIRFRKAEELRNDADRLKSEGYQGPVKVLTSCPSCLQGLQRYKGEVDDLEVDYIVVEIAKHVLGKDWMKDYIKKASRGGIERVLV
jgi:Fe-S oxidoreductase